MSPENTINIFMQSHLAYLHLPHEHVPRKDQRKATVSGWDFFSMLTATVRVPDCEWLLTKLQGEQQN